MRRALLALALLIVVGTDARALTDAVWNQKQHAANFPLDQLPAPSAAASPSTAPVRPIDLNPAGAPCILSAPGANGLPVCATPLASLSVTDPISSTGGASPTLGLKFTNVDLILTGAGALEIQAFTGAITKAAGATSTIFGSAGPHTVLANLTGGSAVPTFTGPATGGQFLGDSGWASVPTTSITGLAAIANSGSANDLVAGTIPTARLPTFTTDVVNAGLAMTIQPNVVTVAKLQQFPGDSLVGVGGSSTANAAAITATADSQVFQRLGGTVQAHTLDYSQLTGTPTSLPPSGAASGDLGGTYPSPTVLAAEWGATRLTFATIADGALAKRSGSTMTGAAAGTDYEVPLTFTAPLTRTVNTVAATDTANGVAFFGSGGNLADDPAHASWDSTNFRLGIRVPGAAPAYQLHLVAQSTDADYANRGITESVYNGGGNGSPVVRIDTASGTVASPGVVTDSMYAGTFQHRVFDGTTMLPTIQLGAHIIPGAMVATGSVPTVWYADSKSGGDSDPFGTRSIFLTGAGSVSISSGVSTWEFDDGAFTGADVGRTFQVIGATNAGNNNFFQIYQVVDGTHVKTVQHTSPNVNETFSRPAVTVAMGVGILATQVFPVATAAGTNFRGTVTNQVAINGQAGVLPYQGDGSGATPAALQIYGGGQILADTSTNLIPAYSFNGVYGAGMSAAPGGALIFYTGSTQATAVASMQMRFDIGMDLNYTASGQPAKVRYVGGLSEFPVTWARSTPGAGTLHLESSTSNHTGVLEVGIGGQTDKLSMSFAGGSGSTAVLSSTNAISITPTGNFAVTTLVGPGFVKANGSGVLSVDTTAYTPTTTTVQGTTPISIGGGHSALDLSANRVWSLDANGVTNSFLAQMGAATIKGNNGGSLANAADLTATQVTAMLNPFTSSLQGLAPLSGGGTSNFLRADGTWAVPAGTGGSGTVTGVFGTSGQVTVTPSSPNPIVSLVAKGAGAGAYGGSGIAGFSLDAFGAVTAVTPATYLTSTGTTPGTYNSLTVASSGLVTAASITSWMTSGAMMKSGGLGALPVPGVAGTDYSAGTASLASGPLCNTTTTGALSACTSTNLYTALGFPTFGQVLVSGGPGTEPIGDSTFTFNPGPHLLTVQTLNVTGIIEGGSEVLVNGATDIANAELVSFQTGNRDHVDLFVGGGAAPDSPDNTLFLVSQNSGTTIPSGRTTGIWATERIEPNGYTGTGSPTITEATGLYIDGAPPLTGASGATYALHVASGESRFDGSVDIASDLRIESFAGSPAPLGVDITGLAIKLPPIAAPSFSTTSFYTEITPAILSNIAGFGTAWIPTSNSALASAAVIEYATGRVTPTTGHLQLTVMANPLTGGGSLVFSITKNGVSGGSTFCNITVNSSTGGLVDSGNCTISGAATDLFGLNVTPVSSPVLAGTLRVSAVMVLSPDSF